MQSKVDHREVFALLEKLAMIEGRHKERLFREYQKLDAAIAHIGMTLRNRWCPGSWRAASALKKS
ncbi:MAG: hypothetical protein KGY56_12785 [Desulfobacterales bacterium]|nr:hypothetical protein [Desulfobacterales bacterium]